MEPPGSTLIDHPGKGELLRTAAGILGGSRTPHADVVALLLPMVRRAVRTEHGPAALVSWLRHCPPLSTHQTERVATLAEDLARLLADAAGSPGDTLDDS